MIPSAFCRNAMCVAKLVPASALLEPLELATERQQRELSHRVRGVASLDDVGDDVVRIPDEDIEPEVLLDRVTVGHHRADGVLGLPDHLAGVTAVGHTMRILDERQLVEVLVVGDLTDCVSHDGHSPIEDVERVDDPVLIEQGRAGVAIDSPVEVLLAGVGPVREGDARRVVEDVHPAAGIASDSRHPPFLTGRSLGDSTSAGRPQ